MITGHGNIHAPVFWITSAFHITDRTKCQMRRQIIFFRAGRLTGMTGNTVIRSKIKAVLFITVRIFSNTGITVDIQ